MAKSEDFSDEVRLRIVREEIEYFEKLIKGHRKLLEALGKA